MARTSESRIPFAQQFVRLGFADIIDTDTSFRSLDFLTEELSTTEVKSVLPIVTNYNAFIGENVATAIERFRGRISGWKFGRAGSPLLIVALPYWTHQVEETPPRTPSGVRISEQQHAALVEELRIMFTEELDADNFEQNGDNDHEYAAWWD